MPNAAAEFLRGLLQGDVSARDASGQEVTFHPRLDPGARRYLAEQLAELAKANPSPR